ncbi:urease accessory protein UreD [Cognatishimia sp. WU-CL00825]|uniref:urease accessory protein UreD n=1 Tax=Cognatishimia sp. WU-CL00825 TaxID=3127658 RepID=UPI0033654C3B
MPRTKGALILTTKPVGAGSGLDRFRSSGAMKALFARGSDVQAILINTSGGLTGGDKIDITCIAGQNSHLSCTTQAAERAYRADSGQAELHTELTVEAGASLHWLPQEMILFDGSALSRSLSVDLQAEAQFLAVEPIVFGRAAMGEQLTQIAFKDRIAIRREGTPLYMDGLDLTGDSVAHLAKLATAQGGGAMASLIYVAPNAEAHLKPLQMLMPQTGGVSLLQPDVLVMRLVAQDSFALRQTLVPVLNRLTDNSLPTSWRL